MALSVLPTLSEIEAAAEVVYREFPPTPQYRWALLSERLDEQARRLKEATELHLRMQQADRDWTRLPDGIPDGHSVCSLIEGAAADVKRKSVRAKSSRVRA